LGLVNGCQGVVKKICYLPGSDVRANIPSVVFVECDGYSGKCFLFFGIDPSWVPIVPVTTIHKSQGITLDKVTIDIGSKDFSSGLSFVAISQVKKLSGI
ncbi:hypothetical protein B0H13DRAFT_1486642, partial [Mycena leptocephala]